MVRYIALVGLALFLGGCHSHPEDTILESNDPMPNMEAEEETETETSFLVVHVEGRSAAGQSQALSDVEIYVLPYEAPTDTHEPQFGHDLPTGEPAGATDEKGDARIEIEPNTQFVVLLLMEKNVLI